MELWCLVKGLSQADGSAPTAFTHGGNPDNLGAGIIALCAENVLLYSLSGPH